MTIGHSLGAATSAMASVNAAQAPIGAQVEAFSRQMMMSDMREELIDEALDSMLTEDADETEENLIIGQVLDELGIETKQTVYIF